jgi:hypothetical protein
VNRIGIGISTVLERFARAEALALQLSGQGYDGGHVLKPSDPVIHVDENRNGPWWNFRRVGELLAGEGHTHVCVLQDDVILCKAFLRTLTRVVEATPVDPLSLFTARRSIVREAESKGTKLLRRYSLDTAQALVFPVFQFGALCRWVDKQERSGVPPAWHHHDDVRIDAWARALRWPIVHVVPSLVDHDTALPSTLGHPRSGRYGARRAVWFADPQHDAAPVQPDEIEWGIPR